MSPGKRQEYNPEEQPQLTNDPKKLGHEPAKSGNTTNKLKYDSDTVSDVDFREVPNEPTAPKGLPAPTPEEDPKKKPRFRGLKTKLKEDIRDKSGDELSEKEVEAIFKQLATGAIDASNKEKQAASDAEKEKQAAATPSSAEMQAKREEDLRKMKRLIRDVMTDSQRKSLWRMLNEKD